VRDDCCGGGGRSGFDKEFWRGADEEECLTRYVEEIGRGVDGAEVAVDVDRVEGSGTRNALRGDRLDDVAAGDVRFEGVHVRVVAFAADVGGIGRYRESDGGLVGQGGLFIFEGGDDRFEVHGGGRVSVRECGVVGWDGEISHDLDNLEKVVKGDDSVIEHEETLWDVEDVFEIPSGARLEVPDAVIAYIAYGTAGKRREAEAGYNCYA
jgi:hypothetical protein